MRLRILVSVVAILAGLASVSTACGSLEPVAPPTEPGLQGTATAASAPPGLPEYAYRSAQAMRGYQVAIEEKELLSRLPCYCGCGQDAESYRNLADCFFDPAGGFNPHAANCLICLEQAEDAARWKSEGLSTREIRDRTDREYEGRGQPTDTPPVG